MMNLNQYELDQETQQYLADSFDDQLPEAPESWELDDFNDLLSNSGYDYH